MDNDGMKKRTTVSATDLRVNLGAMLRRLEAEDLVVEKGGVPVAVLSRYEPVAANQPKDEPAPLRTIGRGPGSSQSGRRDAVYVGREEAVMTEEELLANIAAIRARTPVATAARKAPDDAAWAESMAAIREGWSIDGEELKANIRRWRREGASTRYYTFEDAGPVRHDIGEDDGGNVSDRQRRLHRRDSGERRIADRGDTEYNA